MEQARTNWNDDRLDHLSQQVDSVRQQVDSLGRRMDERFEKQDARIAARFDSLKNSMITTLAGILAAFASAAFAVRL